MKKLVVLFYTLIVYHMTIVGQAVYVDCNTGDDKNPGTKESPVFSVKKAAEIIYSKGNNFYTIKLNPGIYILDNHISVATEKDMKNHRIVIEASILPDDSLWTPEKMPVIASRAKKGEIADNINFVAAFLINESHVTIRGIKFHGYFYPQTRYFPIARFNKSKTDLKVEQCLFVGDINISQIQVGVIAHGDEVKIDHCIFYKIRNSVVFFLHSGNGIKTGNGITNSIIYGVSNAVWTVSPDKDFIFKNNIVSNCRYAWVNNAENPTNYLIEDCIVVNNLYNKGVPDKVQLKPGEFALTEKNVIKNGEISLRLTGTNDKPFLDEIDKPLPIDYMHVMPNTPGFDKNIGLFTNKKK